MMSLTASLPRLDDGRLDQSTVFLFIHILLKKLGDDDNVREFGGILTQKEFPAAANQVITA